MKLDDVDCYNCHSKRRVPYDTENGYHLVRCADCGLLYLSPRPSAEEITCATQTGQHRGESIIDVTIRFADWAIPRYLRILHDFFPTSWQNPSSWLDIGCGHGEFLVALQKHSGGKIVGRGCEPNSQKVASARSRGLDVDFFDLSSHDQQYDHVSMLNVFSHLPDPVATLVDWKRLLKPGGLMLLETGHSAHLAAADHHKPYYLPDHLSFANREIVEGILARAGLQPVMTKIYRHTVFPDFSWKQGAKEAAKRMLGRANRFKDYFPKQPNRDMFILARRER